jgi:ABC-type branched-subunit amino acid transport system ATPase component
MKKKLECDGIYLEFGLSKILTSIYLKCETGQVVGLLGRNGSGKSCLMNIIFGSMEAQSKSVRINDIPILKPFDRNTISYLPQNNFIPSFLTIKEALKVSNVPASTIQEVFPELKDVHNLKPSQLSGGLLRMVEVLLILNLPAAFCLLDEPFSGIMPVHVETLKSYIRECKKDKGIIITDHLHRHITSMSDKLYVLANGTTYHINRQEELVELGYLNESPNPGF